MLSCRKALLLVVVFVLILLPEGDDAIVTESRDNLKKNIRKYFNGQTALQDFLFFSWDELQNYTAINGPPINRTEIRRKKKPTGRNRTKAENTLAKALRQLSRGENVEEITCIAKLLKYVMEKSAENKTTNVCKTLTKLKLGNGRKGQWWRNIRSYLRRKNNKSTRGKRSLEFKDEKEYERRLDADEKKLTNIIDEITNEDFDTTDDVTTDSKSSIEPVSADTAPGLVFDKRLERVYDPEQDSATFSYTGTSTCYVEGSAASSSTYLRLCATCYKTVDFTISVIPQYANSVECQDSAPNCLYGDGTCVQKVIYYTFQQLSSYDSAGTAQWTSFSQALNTSCECECISGTVADETYVGESN